MCSLSVLRYGVEPPVLVKLEKEIELEESLLLASDPAPAVKTFTVCCRHGGLYRAVSPAQPSRLRPPGVTQDHLIRRQQCSRTRWLTHFQV